MNAGSAMNERIEHEVCPVCGRPTFRRVYSYTLGRPGSASYRMIDRWRHDDDKSLACGEEEPEGEYVGGTF